MAHATADTLERPTWLPEEVWPHPLLAVRSGEQIIHVVDTGTPALGDGPTIVLVHAGMWSFIWRDLIDRLRTDFRCVSLDFPGAGLSNGHRSDVDLAEFGPMLNDVLDELDVGRAVFAIHDLGGVVGVNAAADRPERVEGIVAINSFAWPADRAALRRMLSLMGSRLFTGTIGTARLIPLMTRTRFGVGRHWGAAERRAFFGPYRSGGRARNFHRAMRSAPRSHDAFERSDAALASALAGLPALTVFGERNDPFGFADRWATQFPHATQHVVADGNHFPMCDDPDAVATWIREWYVDSVDYGDEIRHSVEEGTDRAARVPT